MEDYMAEAQKAYEARNFKKAFELYKREISARPKSLLARDRAARCLLALKRPLDAVTMSREILDIDPNYALAHGIMAEAYYDMKEISKSKAEIELAYTMAPANSEVLTAYGSLLLFDKKLDNAITFLEKALENDPNNYIAYNNLAVIYTAKRDRAKIYFAAKEMYRLRRSLKNLVRLTIAYMNHTKLSSVLAVAIFILMIVSALTHTWWMLILAVAVAVMPFILGLYLRISS